MIKPSYSEWVGIFCFLQISQLTLFIYALRFLKNTKTEPFQKSIDQLKLDLIKDNQARSGIIIRLLRPEIVIPEAEKVNI